MKTITHKNKTSVFSFHRKVFLSALAVSLTLFSCQKEENITPIQPIKKTQTQTESIQTPFPVNNHLPPVNPTIRYVSINQFNAIGAGNGRRTETFDINGDGTADFETVLNKDSSNQLSVEIYAKDLNRISTQTNLISDFGAYLTTVNEFYEGNSISDSTSSWKHGGHLYVKLKNFYPISSNQGTDSYAGIKLVVNNKTYYGWLRYSFSAIANETGIAAIINIKDAAYEQTAGFAIEAGRKI